MTILICTASKFLSTLSLRRATCSKNRSRSPFQHFYPRSPCGERLPLLMFPISSPPISIHALLAESDTWFSSLVALTTISIHALLAESDAGGSEHCHRNFDFYPRSPCGERLVLSIYAAGENEFLSTLSLRRATGGTYTNTHGNGISIHALLAESDP